jgi:hypothetical protein
MKGVIPAMSWSLVTDVMPMSEKLQQDGFHLCVRTGLLASVLTSVFVLFSVFLWDTAATNKTPFAASLVFVTSTFLSGWFATMVTYRKWDIQHASLNERLVSNSEPLRRPTLLSRFMMACVFAFFVTALIVMVARYEFTVQTVLQLGSAQLLLVLGLGLVVYSALVGFLVAFLAAFLNRSGRLLVVALSFLVGLTIASRHFGSNTWLDQSVSALGSAGDSMLPFSITLIMVGFGLMVYVQDLSFDLELRRALTQQPLAQLELMNFLLVMTSVGLIGVAVFRIGTHYILDALHYMFAVSMLGVIFVMARLEWFIPRYFAKPFRSFSWIMVGVCSLFAVMYIVIDLVLKTPFFVQAEFLFGIAIGLWLYGLHWATVDANRREVAAQAPQPAQQPHSQTV